MCSKMPVLLLLLLLLCHTSRAGHVLMLHPMHSPSHVLALQTLALEMTGRGHQVTVVRPHDTRLPPMGHPNVTEHFTRIDNTGGSVPMMSHQHPAQFEMPMSLMWAQGTSFRSVPVEGFFALSAHCQALLADAALITELRDTGFQVAVVDLLYNECSLALAHHLGVPVVGYWAFTFSGGEPQYTTAFNPPSSTPIVLSHLSHHMTFFQRVWNHLLVLGSELVMQITFVVTSYHINSYLPASPTPRELLANLSGMLINSHPAIDYPRLLPPSFLEVGGFHIKDPKPLPDDLVRFINDGEYAGTILFSLGSTFNAKYIPDDVMREYLEAFSSLPYNVIMVVKGTINKKHEIPANVKTVKWVPQVDVLAEPRILLFVTHCGMHSVMEALTYGVPMVGIPVFSDQQDVLLRLQERHLAVGVDKHGTNGQLRAAILRVMADETYRARAAHFSALLAGQLSRPLTAAAWLLEHVMATGGAHHLKMASRNMGLLTYLGLDVMAFLLLLPATGVVLINALRRYLLSHRTTVKQKVS